MQSLKGKKLLILAGAYVHCKVVEAAREMGVYTIVTDYLESSPAKDIADESWMLNITDVDGIVEKCKEEKVDGVLNFCIDPAQRPYVQICEKLGVHCYATPEQMHIMTDKPSFKEFCVKNGLDIIPSYTVEDIEADRCEYPIFVKPTDSRGSRGQAICYDKESALSALAVAAKESSDGGVVVEKYMEGKQDFSMTYMVWNGVPYLTRTNDRYLGKVEDGLNKQCVGAVCPSRHSDFYVEKIHEKAVRFIDALGIKNGPIFMQGFIDGDKICFYDPGLRFPGGEYERLLNEVVGVNIMKAFVEFALTGKIIDIEGIEDNPYLLKGYHTIQLPICAHPGTIYRYEGVEEIKNDPRVIKFFKRYEEGETVPESGDVRQRVCEIALITKPGESVREAVEWVQKTLKVLDENNESMLVSLVDTKLLD